MSDNVSLVILLKNILFHKVHIVTEKSLFNIKLLKDTIPRFHCKTRYILTLKCMSWVYSSSAVIICCYGVVDWTHY